MPTGFLARLPVSFRLRFDPPFGVRVVSDSMMLIRSIALLAVFCLPLAVACGGGGTSSSGAGASDPPEPPPGGFASETSSEFAIDIAVFDDVSAPMQYVMVQVVSAAPGATLPDEEEDFADGLLYFQGATNASGRVQGVISVPTNVTEVDVIIDDDDFTGTYTYEPLRTEWGVFAPSSRLTVTPSGLNGLNSFLDPI